MQTDFKEINIGIYIHQCIKDREMNLSTICNFMKCSEDEINKIYHQKSMNTETLLQWSKLLKYDFFRPYIRLFYIPHLQKLKTSNLRKVYITQENSTKIVL